MNRNLHSPTKLTEFARDFDTEPDTFLSKFVNKITNAYNSGYNTVNVIPTSSPVLSVSTTSTASTSQNSSPAHSINSPQSSSSSSSTLQSVQQVPSARNEQNNDDPNNPNDMRAPQSVINRIGGLMNRNPNNLVNYKNTELHQFWMPDSKSKECYDCSQTFSTFRRKHHCRLCGQIFCSKCCNQEVPGKIINCSGDLRVCNYCSKIVLAYLESSDVNSSDLQALQAHLSSKLSLQNYNPKGHSHDVASPQRKISVGYQEERLLSRPKNSLSNADRRTILQQSTSLKILYEELLNELPHHIRGSDLLQYLISKNKSSNKTQAIAILTAMLEAGYLMVIETPPMYTMKTISTASGVAHDESYSSDSDLFNEFSENVIYKFLQAHEILPEGSPSHTARTDKKFNELEDNLPKVDEPFSLNQWREMDKENALISTTGSKNLHEAFCHHEELLLAQLLQNESLDLSWSKILLQICARIVNTLPVEIIGGDSMDIRNYVNFKKVPDGQRSESSIVVGTVFSKNVVHKDMSTTVENARILLVQCPIVHQREEGKFISIETVLLQERQNLSNVIGRIRSLNPNVILVHKNVSGIAQDMLRECNITLVLDVKLSVLKRISRCLRCDILCSIESNIGKPTLGFCDKFHVRRFVNSFGHSKTLMFIENPSSPRGFSVLLRGGPVSELVRVKRVASFLLYARYNWRFELSLLMNAFAEPPPQKANIFETETQENLPESTSQKQCVKKSNERKFDEKIVLKENVDDLSDPLRAGLPIETEEGQIELAVEFPCDNQFRTSINSVILSVSPFSHFPLPYLETESGKRSALRLHFPDKMYFSKQWSDDIEENHHVDFHTKNRYTEKPLDQNNHEFLVTKFTIGADTKEFQSLLANFRASGGILKKVVKMDKIEEQNGQKTKRASLEDANTKSNAIKDVLDIKVHQRLPVLFCNYYHSPEATSAFCAPPFLLNMSFYGENDIMLGQFLEHYCFDNTYICSSCKLPTLDHVRRYVHSSGCVTIKLCEDLHSKDLKNISMMSFCLKCQVMTPSLVMQKDTWCLSFGKYLEMRFHGHVYRRRKLNNPEELKTYGDIPECIHSLHRDHIHYFSFNGIVASIIYTPIDTWEIQLPSLFIVMERSSSLINLITIQDVKFLSTRGHEIYATVYDILAQLMGDMNDPTSVNLKQLVNNDQFQFKDKINFIQTQFTENKIDVWKLRDAYVTAKRTLAESIEAWNQRLNDVVTQSKSSKNEVTQSAALQRPASVDSATICTEDLKSEEMSSASESKPIYSRETSSEVDGAKAMNESGSNEHQPRTSGDKKSMKERLRELLPSDKNTLYTITSPLPPNEHHLLPSGRIPIVVNDQDLSSIIAYSLTSNDYRKILNTLQFCEISKKPVDSLSETDEKDGETSQRKGNKSQAHVEITFQDSNGQFSCKIYFARDFDALRGKCLRLSNEDSLLNSTEDGNEAYLENIRIFFSRSLSQSVQWEAMGGKSGSKFCKTIDDRFVLKEMSQREFAIFEDFAPNYFEYIHSCLKKNQSTLLAKILGVFRVNIKKKDNVVEKSLLVMENLFYQCNISNKFDLKGSTRNRYVDNTNYSGKESEIVFWDENFIQMSWSKPLYILPHSKKVLRDAINRDASFLQKNHIMDYSLLTGLDISKKILVFGIIDYIRTFTFDKMLESFMKQKTSLGKGPLPTIVSPKIYRQRFTEAMDRYFLMVPDRWEGLESKN